MALPAISKAPISPDDVNMMHGVLVEWCSRNGVPIDSQEGEAQARHIINWFESGCCDEALLREVFMPPRCSRQQ